MSVARIDLDPSGSGSVFAPPTSAKTTYVRLKLTLANSGDLSSPAGKVIIRTIQQYGVVTHTTSYSISGVIGAHASTTVTVLAPIDRIAKGWETGCVFEVKVDHSDAIRESNENDNVSFGYGYYGYDLFGEYFSRLEQAIGRGLQPIPKPKPIKDDGFFIPDSIPNVKQGPVYR